MFPSIGEMAELLSLLPEDYGPLADYLASFPQETRGAEFWRDRFRLWWDHNPAFSNSFERGWVLKNKGKIVGFLGNFPSYFQLSGEPTIVNNATTWRVSLDYRNYSLLLLFKQMNYSKGTLLFLTTPNDSVKRMVQILRYQLIQRGDQRVSVLFTNFEKVIDTFLHKNYVSRFIAKGLAPTFNLIQQQRLKLFRGEEGLCVREVFKADSAFDQLWERTKSQYPHTNVRAAEVINWYCFGSPNFRKKLFGVYRENHLLVYAIFSYPLGRRLNLLECFDFWGEFKEKKAVASLVHYLKEYAQLHSIDWIKFRSFSREMGDLFKELGLFKIKARNDREYFKTNLKPAKPITEPNTYFTYTVGDIGL